MVGAGGGENVGEVEALLAGGVLDSGNADGNEGAGKCDSGIGDCNLRSVEDRAGIVK